VTEEADVFFCGADRGTNNTGELVGIGQGLMWLRDLAGDTPGEAVMLYDSGYAANVTSGRWKANANHALVAWTRRLLAEVEAVRTVHWVHVKGHSADGGNDRADALVQWGKGDGPFARLRENGGEGESRYGAATNWVALQTNGTAVEEKAAEARGAASSVALGTNVIVGRRGLEEADQANHCTVGVWCV
jgi:ribonuclease HI